MSKVADKFSALFKKALTDKEGGKDKSAKQKETDYYNLNFFINGLKKKEHLQECLDEYLGLFTNYQPLDRRSKFVFAQLVTKRIDASKPDDKFLVNLSDIIAGPTVSAIKLRYDDLEDREKKEIKNALAYKLQLKKQETSVLDLLKEFFEKTKGQKPDDQALLNFNPVSDPDYLQKFETLRSECRTAWSAKDAEAIGPALQKYIAFLSKETDAMKLFQVIKHKPTGIRMTHWIANCIFRRYTGYLYGPVKNCIKRTGGTLPLKRRDFLSTRLSATITSPITSIVLKPAEPAQPIS
jgi:hypothetical protein